MIDGTDKLATAGFVNAHTHVSMTLLRSYADDMKLMDWLENKIWPIEAKMKKKIFIGVLCLVSLNDKKWYNYFC